MTAEGTTTLQIQRAIVVAGTDNGLFRVLPDGADTAIEARFVITCGCHSTPKLVNGDAVLVVEAGVGAAVIVGALHDRHNHEDIEESPSESVSDIIPETVVLQASEELCLRVGDGSITIRKDGKILIRGKDLVSHAQRVNRIKGGSVSIN